MLDTPLMKHAEASGFVPTSSIIHLLLVDRSFMERGWRD